MITEKANAKINLFLNVTERRTDGYHNIESIMHSVDLHDVVSVEVNKSDRAKITVKTNAGELRDEKSNLVYIAAEKYIAKYSITDEIIISHEKNIPIGAGLGGGSSDAAATLRALNRIYGKCGSEELLRLASDVGSDVPFCLVGGTAICLGRGEIIEPLNVKEKLYFALAIGEERVSTPQAFAALDNRYISYPEKSDVCREMALALENGDTVSDFVYNIFEEITEIASIKEIKEIMKKSGAECTLMSGSGPAVFGMFKTEEEALAAVKKLLACGFVSSYAESATVSDITV